MQTYFTKLAYSECCESTGIADWRQISFCGDHRRCHGPLLATL